MRRKIWFATIALGCGWPAAATAQATSVGMAEALFEDGRELLRDGSLELACAKLNESYRIDPALGTLLSYADCEERRGHFSSAWALWLEAASAARTAKQLDREALARARALRVRDKLGTLTIDVPTEARAPGLAISCDGSVWGPASWGTEAPLEPGEHTLVVTAPGRTSLQEKVILAPGRSLRFRIRDLPAAASAQPAPLPSAALRPREASLTGERAPSNLFRGLAWLSGLGSLTLLAVSVWPTLRLGITGGRRTTSGHRARS